MTIIFSRLRTHAHTHTHDAAGTLVFIPNSGNRAGAGLGGERLAVLVAADKQEYHHSSLLTMCVCMWR